jgi:serine/threonine protein kinase
MEAVFSLCLTDATMADGEKPKAKPVQTGTKVTSGGLEGAGAKKAAAGPVPMAAEAEVAPRRSSSTHSKDPLIGKKLQEYVLESRLGVGGMGVVYKAVQPMIGKYVAIKVLRADVVTDVRDMDRLLEEARVVSAIKNRGIINIFGAGSLEDGRHYLIMELLEGESLEQLMQRDVKIPAVDAVMILEQVLSALSAAHDTGVVHRDLKPANIFLVTEGAQTYVKILDFGLARRVQANVTRIAGTPDYISPEHARGRPAGPPSDLYAVGILAFHMLTGRLPFLGNTPIEVMEQHVHSPPPVPHEVDKSIPKALSELILKLLSKEPADRPDANKMKADLKAATKQLRNASTMMSLMSIEAVKTELSDVQPDEAKREKELVREARVADLKRHMSRKWPIIAGISGLVFLSGAVAFAMWPNPEAPTKRAKDPLASSVTKEPNVDPLRNTDDSVPERRTETQGSVDTNQIETAPDKKSDPTEPVEVKVDDPLAEDPNTELDDFRLGELLRRRGIDDGMESMAGIMAHDSDKMDYFRPAHDRVKKLCFQAKKLREFWTCEDEYNKLKDNFYRTR